MTRPFLSPLPRQPRAAVTECVRLQCRQHMAAAGAADRDRPLVADQLAAAAGENRRTVDQARPVLLATLGGPPSHSLAVCRHAAQDRGAAVAGGIAQGGGGFQIENSQTWDEEVSLEIGRRWPGPPFGSTRNDETVSLARSLQPRRRQTLPTFASRHEFALNVLCGRRSKREIPV